MQAIQKPHTASRPRVKWAMPTAARAKVNSTASQ
jgi:hypothetical protein